MNSILALDGWRLRALFFVTEILTRLGLAPTGEKVIDMPLEQRASSVPANWMLRPMPETGVERTQVQGRDCMIPVKRFLPKTPGDRPLQILFMHGGGWFAGCEDSLDYLCTNMCDGAGAVVTSVGYRLAPEYPFPSGLNDCEDVFLELIKTGDPIIIVGDSAGGNLCAALALRQKGHPQIKKQILIYPFLDALLQSPSIDPPRHGLTRDGMIKMVDIYCNGVPADDQYVSPMHADDLRELAPALIITADLDPLRDEGVRYAEKLKAANIPVEFKNYKGMPHGFLSTASICKAAPDAIELVVGGLNK